MRENTLKILLQSYLIGEQDFGIQKERKNKTSHSTMAYTTGLFLEQYLLLKSRNRFYGQFD